jgi:hypothetical protein
MKKDLNKLTFEQLEKEVASLKNKVETVDKPKGFSYCVVRTFSAGVFTGLFDRKNKGKEGTVFNARRIFYWDGAASLSQFANEGVKKPDNCKFAQEVEEVDLREIIEVIPCTKVAEENINSVKIWEQ